MKRGPIVFMFSLFLVMSMFLCLGGKAYALRELSFSTTMADKGIDRALTQRFKEKVNELSNGAMKINLFMSGILGDTREQIELMKLGEIDLGYFAEFGQLYYPQYDATTIPFLWPNGEAVEEYLSGPIGEKIKKLTEEKGGVILLGPIHSYGSRWTTSNRPIHNVDDLKGLKIRMPNIAWWIEVWKTMGASPTPVSSSEIYSALQAGVVDAQENFLSNIFGRKLWEVQKYAIATKHIDFYLMWAVSKVTWDTLTKDQQDILVDAAYDAVKFVKPQVDEMNEGFIKSLKDNGMEVIYPDRQSLIKAARPAMESIIERELDPEVKEQVYKYIE